MSYAHEIFGVKETRYDIWKQDLMLAGTASTTFNSDRMQEIASSAFVKDDGFAGYYMLLWCKYNNIPLNQVMRVGQKVAVQNNDYGTVDNYVLVTLTDSLAYFVSEYFVAYMPTILQNSTHYDGNPNNSLIGAWLKAENPNWHPMVAPTAKSLGAIVADYGYMHGIPEELKDILKQNKSQPTYVYPIIHDTPYFLWNDWYPLGVTNKFGPTSIRMAKIISNGNLSDKMKLGNAFWSVMLPTKSTEGMAYPTYGPTWLEKPYCVGSLEQIQTLKVQNLSTGTVENIATNSLPSFVYSTPHLARFTIEY